MYGFTKVNQSTWEDLCDRCRYQGRGQVIASHNCEFYIQYSNSVFKMYTYIKPYNYGRIARQPINYTPFRDHRSEPYDRNIIKGIFSDNYLYNYWSLEGSFSVTLDCKINTRFLTHICRTNGHHFGDIFKFIFLNENVVFGLKLHW